ncbi:hypothetical protein CR513_22261, partial [Mucuna pruriens]
MQSCLSKDENNAGVPTNPHQTKPGKVLHDLEIWYQRINKATLALVIIVRRLRSYFQSNQIIVQIELPIKQDIRKPDLAGRMVGWMVELLEFDIPFKRRGHVEAQTLVDFIPELALVGKAGSIGKE